MIIIGTNFHDTSFTPKSRKPPVRIFHSEMGGHLGINKTFHKLKQHFFATSALKKLEDYLNSCETCNFRKNPQIYPNPAMGRTPKVRFPFDIVSFDLYGTIVGLPTSNKGHICVLSVISHFSGFMFAKLLKNQSAYTTSKALARTFFIL